MAAIRKQQITYALVIAALYFIIRNVVERSMDGTWIPVDRQWLTILEGLVVGTLLTIFKSGKNDGKMPN